MQVLKYRLRVDRVEGSTHCVGMPVGSRILSVGYDSGVMVWALVNPTRPIKKVSFIVVATGEEFEYSASEELRYVGRADAFETGIGADSTRYHVFQVLSR